MNMRLHPYQYAVLILFVAKAIFLASLVAKVPDIFVYGDGNEYKERAETLWRVGTFGKMREDGSVFDDAYRLPGYPVFLALSMFTDSPVHVPIWSAVQLVLFHIWLLIVGSWIARRHGMCSATYFAVALSLTLPWLHYVTAIHSDFQFAVLVFSGALMLVSASETAGSRRATLAGAILCLGSASLTRPDLIFFPFWLLVFWVALVLWNARTARVSDRLAALPSFVVALGTFCFMAAWTLRNFAVTGRFAYTSFVDTVIELFVGHADSASQGAGSGLRVVKIVQLIILNAEKIVSNSVSALAQLFFNPSRWYLHFYMDGLGVELSSSGVPFSEIGFWSLPPLEHVYIVMGILVPLAIFAVFIRFAHQLVTGQAVIAWPLAALILWMAAYFVLQKVVWGALTPGSGQRYAMSILPFAIFLGSLTFSDRRSKIYPEKT